MSRREEVIPVQEPETKTEKCLEQMTDAEFVYNLDRMSRPDLITRLSDVCTDPVSIEDFLRKSNIKVIDGRIPFTIELPKQQVEEAQKATEIQKEVVAPTKEKKEKFVAEVGSVKKRTVWIVLVALFSLVAIAAIVLGAVGIKYVFPVETEEKTYGIADPVAAAVDVLFKTESGAYFGNAFAGAVTWQDKLIAYATAAATILFAVCFVAMFIKAMYAAFDKGKNGVIVKKDFIFPSVAALICAIVMFFGTMSMLGVPFVDFITGASVPKIGYATYGTVALPILTLLFGAFAYGKNK